VTAARDWSDAGSRTGRRFLIPPRVSIGCRVLV